MIKEIVKPIFKRIGYNAEKKRALNALRSIESGKGKTNSKLIKRSDEYAREKLGWKGYAPWLYVYCAIAGEFKEGWIPNHYYKMIMAPKLEGDYGKISFSKGLTRCIFNTDDFPDSYYHTNALWLTNDYAVISEEKVKENLSSSSQKYVFKSDQSFQGKGVTIFDRKTLDFAKLNTLGNGVLQTYIPQHSFFESITPGSVATLRLTTAMDASGRVSLKGSYLRLGRKTDLHVKSTTHIRVP